MAGRPCKEEETKPVRTGVKWACGVTTHPKRRDDLLPRTLESLKAAGFEAVRLFVDGATNREALWWEERFNLPVTARFPALRVAGNWVLALYELYYRDPSAERFVVFQDDLVVCRNLRRYLERLTYPDGPVNKNTPPGYWNLYASPSEQNTVAPDFKGFALSNQNGRGALALVFSRQAVITLLSSDHLAQRPCDEHRGWRIIDGGIMDSMRKAGWKEYVHHPSLVQHTGKVGTFSKHNSATVETIDGLREHRWPDVYDMTDFPGEQFDALELLVKRV